jgi:hypothetical protein
MKAWTAVLCAALLAQDDHDAAAVRKAVPTAASLEKKNYEFKGDDAERVRKAAGEPPAGRVIYHAAQADLMFPETAKYKIRLTATTVPGSKGPIKLVVAIIPSEHVVVGVHALEHGEAEALTEFLGQFEGLPYAEDSIWRPSADLDQRRGRADKPESEEDRELSALLRTRASMATVGELFPRAGGRIRAKDAEAARDLEELKEAFQKLAAAAEMAKFLGDSKQTKVKQMIADGADRMEKMAQLVRAGDWAEAQNRYADAARKSCGSCHGGYQTSFRNRRDQLGLGNGYFSLGYDLREVTGLDRNVQEALARAVRRCVMLLELAR